MLWPRPCKVAQPRQLLLGDCLPDPQVLTNVQRRVHAAGIPRRCALQMLRSQRDHSKGSVRKPWPVRFYRDLPRKSILLPCRAALPPFGRRQRPMLVS
jgi:hypothetical protein